MDRRVLVVGPSHDCCVKQTERRITIFRNFRVSFFGDFYEISHGRSPSVVVIIPSYSHVIDVRDYSQLIRWNTSHAYQSGASA